jgi:PKD repeat protein
MRKVFNLSGRWRVPVAAGVVAVGVLVFPTSAFAQPANDNFSSATVITSLPFSDSVDGTLATTEPGEPNFFCNNTIQTVWYQITPATNSVLTVDMSGTGPSNNVAVYHQTGSGFGGLSLVGCASFGSSVTWNAQGGQTYYIQAGSIFGDAGTLNVNVKLIPPPANDDFANATAITSLPFSDTANLLAATVEPGEPLLCNNTVTATVWYSFTPSVSESVMATINTGAVAAYTGSSLTGLTSQACEFSNQPFTIHVNQGVTYYYQVGSFCCSSLAQFQLQVAPPPSASFAFFPQDPSIFDTIQFEDTSFDPGFAGFASAAWSFGDGTTATGFSPTHRYASDGDYTVKLTVTTVDGRTASASQVVHVKTNDVAITKFAVPQTASVGQTRSISVGISNARYPETVQVTLLKSVPGSFFNQIVGTLTQSVPVLPGNRTTPFSFNYTFTSDDGVAGTVTFEAGADMIGARDANTFNNHVIALPTKVNP